MATRTTRTTLALPSELLEQVDRAVQAGKARSRNAFVAEAIRHELDALREAEIDAEFALMADDAEYRALAETLDREFATADWEAFRLTQTTS